MGKLYRNESQGKLADSYQPFAFPCHQDAGDDYSHPRIAMKCVPSYGKARQWRTVTAQVNSRGIIAACCKCGAAATYLSWSIRGRYAFELHAICPTKAKRTSRFAEMQSLLCVINQRLQPRPALVAADQNQVDKYCQRIRPGVE